MYLNISKDIIIRTKDIVGIFNLDYIRNTREYKNFFNNLKEYNKILVTSENDKTLILTENNKNIKGYITNISTSTIGKRKKNKNKLKVGGNNGKI